MADMFSSLGGAISSLFGAGGDMAMKRAYRSAATYTGEMENVSSSATALEQTMVSRQALKTIGAQQSQYASAGMASSGSALDVLRSSEQQAALSHQVLQTQGEINTLGYETQKAMYKANASAAGAAAQGSYISGAMQMVGAIAQMAGYF